MKEETVPCFCVTGRRILNSPPIITAMQSSTDLLLDKYDADSGRVFLSGTQALVRLPLVQSRLDRQAKRNTAGFISGYRGSPLGTYDTELWRAAAALADHNVVFQPGVNEDLAATAIWGTQQLNLFPGAKHDGVFSLWYGKGPGVDRSGDAFKHANLAGTAPYGGVLVAFGDDHGAKSSTAAHQSEQALIAAMIPILNPSTIEDILKFGIFGWAMSRYAGVWVGLKCVNELVESSASVALTPQHPAFSLPSDIVPVPGGVHIRDGFEPVEAERRLLRDKLPMAVAFARANSIDKVIWSGAWKKLGIVTTGKAYLDVRQALARLAINEERAAALGIGIYKIGLAWPLEPDGLRNFATGYEELLIVEEKRAVIEDQAARLLYALPTGSRPAITGKYAGTGEALLPSDGVLDPLTVSRAICARLRSLGVNDSALGAHTEAPDTLAAPVAAPDFGIARRPYFCSGCPHNTSTKVPAGSRAMAGIGCSYMAVWMDRETMTSVHMGAEGANWNGIFPFTETPHVFQNIGDGTYFHSGLLAIRAAVVAGASITYKILVNDAVAMTGGQPVDGPLTVPQISRQVAAEGVRRIAVVTDEPGKYPVHPAFAEGVTIHQRSALEAVQKELRGVKGPSVLIYDQTCAAEKRRRRKRREYPEPLERVFINSAVCEGCGDCTTKSNCVSVQPLETEFGRKRQIDQSACNKDYSCLDGFCPSFVTVRGARPRTAEKSAAAGALTHALPEPGQAPLTRSYSVVIAGIGGTGVVTISAILGLAAHLDGKQASTFDMTGLAQKNGAVISYIRIGAAPSDIHAVRVGRGETDLLIGCDLVVSGSSDILQTTGHGQTRAIINDHLVPTGDFFRNTDIDFHSRDFKTTITNAIGNANTEFIDVTAIALRIAGDSIATNLFMVGYACQKGLLPVSPASVVRAIEANGVAVADNIRNFQLGRLAAHSPDLLPGPATAPAGPSADASADPITRIIARRAEFLAGYHNRSHAEHYKTFLNEVCAAEAQTVGTAGRLSETVARSLFRLMAVKDEYEVARQLTAPEFLRALDAQFEGRLSLAYHLAPPILSVWSRAGRQPAKIKFGPWFKVVLLLVAKCKWLRGTVFDPFGYTRERRDERQLIEQYKVTVRTLLTGLTAQNHALATEIASLPEEVRGFGHVKVRAMARFHEKERTLLARFAGSAQA